MSFDVPKEFGVPDEIGDMMRSLEMVEVKDRYIGRLYSDIGKVLSDSGIFRSTGELREYGEEYWALMGLSGKEPGGGAHPSQAQSELDKGFGARPPSPFLLHFPPFPPSPSWTRKEGALLPVGVGLPLARPPPLFHHLAHEAHCFFLVFL